jgi:hypothetical protein
MKDWIMEQYIKERVESMGHKVGEATELMANAEWQERLEVTGHLVGEATEIKNSEE